MQEEFHGINHGGGIYTYKQLYNWNSVNANVWLPSLSELVGIDSNHYNATSGVYFSAMQGLNTSMDYCVDPGGDSQLTYFVPYNTDGGGEKIWDTCNQQQSWLRSIAFANSLCVWFTNLSSSRFDWIPAATASHAIHPAVGEVQIDTLSFFPLFLQYPPKVIKGIERSWGRRPCKRSIMRKQSTVRQYINACMDGAL